MSLSTLPVFARWGVLIALSVRFAALLTWARLPPALLLGSMLAGILVENGGAGILEPQLPFCFALGIIGCMIARVLTSTILHSFLHQWPLLLGISFSVIVASCLLGWLISRFRILPETTAIWGLLAGAASAMMVMADAYGADARLVAFMQYVRVVMVAIVASIIARLWVHAPAVAAAAPEVWFAPIHALPLMETLVLVVAAVVLGPVSRIPAGTLLIPILVGAVLQINGLVSRDRRSESRGVLKDTGPVVRFAARAQQPAALNDVIEATTSELVQVFVHAGANPHSTRLWYG